MPGGTTMPRGKMIDSFLDWDPRPPRFKMFKAPDWAFKLKLNPREFRDAHEVPEKHRQQLERFRLFSIATRNYLRRRAWRYFRKLGRQHPERYIAAVCEALILYEDDDVKDSLALIDNWGLVHILFHHSPALLARPRGWIPAEGHSLDELAPAPMFERLWKAAARALLDVMIRCRCRPVRQWAIQLVRRDPQAVMDAVTLEELLGMLAHADGEVVALAAELLRGAQGLATLSPERWLALAETDNPAALEILAELIERYVPPEQVSLAQAVRLALSRPLPLARLGLAWLRTKTPHGDDECRMLLGLVEAEAEAVRPELLHWARGQLSAAPEFRPDWVLEYLDCRHADARAEGWAWLNDEPRARDDVSLWQRLLESPYDDVHLALVAMLEKHVTGRDLDQAARLALDPGLLRLLWASVLLNIHRGGRAKPVVIGQLLRRLEARPEEATELLPLLGVALRSVRGPEWRAGLAAVVQLVERDANTAPLVRAAFPELQLT